MRARLLLCLALPASAASAAPAVTGVTASAPLASSGGSTPNISLTGIIPLGNLPSLSSLYADLTTAQTIAGQKTFASPIVGSLTGNASSVTNGLYSTGSYANPAWITSLAASKITGTVSSANIATSVLGSFAGDVTGIQAGTSVVRIQGRNVSAALPGDGWSLVYSVSGGGWVPAPALLGLNATYPLQSTGGVNPTLGLSVIPPAFGGTGITSSPPAAGYFLRSDAANRWAIGTLQAADVPDLSASYVNLSTSQVASGSKIFTGPVAFAGPVLSSLAIQANITGNAATVTDGLYASARYADPAWLVSLHASKIVGSIAPAHGGTGTTGPGGTERVLAADALGASWTARHLGASDLIGAQTVVASSPSLVIDVSDGRGLVEVDMTIHVTSWSVSGCENGQELRIAWRQLDTPFTLSGADGSIVFLGHSAPALTATPGAIDYQAFTCWSGRLVESWRNFAN